MFNRKATLIVLVLNSFLLFGAYATMQSSYPVSTNGLVKSVNVQVFDDSALTVATVSIEWGLVEPDSSVVKTLYVLNNGTAPVTLSMITSDWNPSRAIDFMQVTWDAESVLLQPKTSMSVNISLNVLPSIATSGIEQFSFDITIIGAG